MYGVLRILYFFIAYRKSLGCKLSWKCLDWDKINLIPSDQVPPTPWLTEAVCLRQLESTADLPRSVSATSHLRDPSCCARGRMIHLPLQACRSVQPDQTHSLRAAFEEKQTASIQSFSYQMLGYPADKRTLSLLFWHTSNKPGEVITSWALEVVPASKSLCKAGEFLLVVLEGMIWTLT